MNHDYKPTHYEMDGKAACNRWIPDPRLTTHRDEVSCKPCKKSEAYRGQTPQDER